MSDGSIDTEGRGGAYSCEIVTPVCRWEDIEDIQEIVRQLRHKGAKANASCGIHVHVGAEQHTAKTLRNLVNTKPTTESSIERIWYGGNSHRSTHYDSSRYHALNLHSLWQGKGIEFRCFNGTTHAGKIKTYIQLCLAISHQALTQKGASAKKTASANEKYTFRTWLLRMGMIGDEFETARKWLLENLSGDIAFKGGWMRSAERLPTDIPKGGNNRTRKGCGNSRRSVGDNTYGRAKPRHIRGVSELLPQGNGQGKLAR